jgi:hypothetical protein
LSRDSLAPNEVIEEGDIGIFWGIGVKVVDDFMLNSENLCQVYGMAFFD